METKLLMSNSQFFVLSVNMRFMQSLKIATFQMWIFIYASVVTTQYLFIYFNSNLMQWSVCSFQLII